MCHLGAAPGRFGGYLEAAALALARLVELRLRVARIVGSSLRTVLTRPRTADTDFLNAAFSVRFNETCTTRSTPPAPMTTGTPTYRPRTPYSPSRYAAQGRTRRLSFK